MALQDYLAKREGLIAKQKEILSKIMTEKRNMTVDEKSTFDNLDTEIASTEQTIETLKEFRNKESQLDNQFDANVPSVNAQKKEENLFQNDGEFYQSVAVAYREGNIDDRLVPEVSNAASGHSANVPSDGGFLISPTKSKEIWEKIYDGGAILSRCRQYEVGQYSDSLEVPYIQETSRANGSRWGGLRVYREGEVDTPTSSKTKYGMWECRVTDIKGLVYVTDRLLQDAPALQSYIADKMPEEFTFKLEDEILNGEGGASCKGIIGDTATVSVTKETGQSTTTLLAENIIKMHSRCWGKSRLGAAWFHNQDIEPELLTMSLNVGVGGVPLFMPANGLSTTGYNTLFGKPLIPVEQAATLGTVGDIVLANFNEYAIVKKGGLQQASSMHVKFLTDEMAFRFKMRINGKPKWNNVLTPFKGTNTYSPFVTVATRA